MSTLYAPHLQQEDRLRLGKGGAADAPLNALAASVLQGLYWGDGQARFHKLGWRPSDVTLFQMAHATPETPGSFGLAFEVAVHEAINSGLPDVASLISEAMADSGVRTSRPRSILFGAERAARLGFLDALVTDLGERPVLRIGANRRGAPFSLSRWLPIMAQGWRGEQWLPNDISKVWKADLLLADAEGRSFVPATVKSNPNSLEGGPGLRVGIVPQAPGWQVGVRDWKGLKVVILPDDGPFLDLLTKAYLTVTRALNKLAGRHNGIQPALAAGKRLEADLLSWATSPVLDVIDTLKRRGQRGLISERLRQVELYVPETIKIPGLSRTDEVELESGLLVPVAN